MSNVSGFDLQRIDERNRSVCNMCVDDEHWGFAVDDLSGVDLPLDLVVAARKEEMDHMLGHTFHIVDEAGCHPKTGQSPISTRWIDTDKSHGHGVMKVRSRFVARDLRKSGKEIAKICFARPHHWSYCVW